MSNTTSVAIRLDKNLKDGAVAVLDGLGIDLTTAVKMFLSQVVLRKGVPFSVTHPEQMDIPNDETLAALDWAKTYKNAGKKTGFKSARELYQSLDI